MQETSSSPQPSVPQPSPPTSSSKLPLILVGLALLFVSATGGFLLGKQLYSPASQPTPTSIAEPTPIPDPTANWKTYIYQNLVFKYPPDWVLDTEKMAIRPPYLKNGEEYPAITLYTIDNPDNLSVKEYDDKASNAMMRPGLYSSSIGDREVTAEIKVVNGIKGYYLKDQNCEPLGCDRFSFVSNKKIYVITNIYDHQDVSSQNSEKESLRKIFNQILSTFKFTEEKTLNSTFSATLPEPFQLMQSSVNVATYGFDNFEYLVVTSVPTINLETLRPLTKCSNLAPGQFCLDSGKGWGQAKDIGDITVGGRPAKSFYISGGVDNAYHVVQTIQEPILEFKMYVAGGGLDQRFQNFLSSLKFLKP